MHTLYVYVPLACLPIWSVYAPVLLIALRTFVLPRHTSTVDALPLVQVSRAYSSPLSLNPVTLRLLGGVATVMVTAADVLLAPSLSVTFKVAFHVPDVE